MSHPLHLARVIHLSRDSHYPSLARVAMKFAVVVTLWDHRFRTRRQLSRLEPHQLDDIGRSRSAALREAQRPFWER